MTHQPHQLAAACSVLMICSGCITGRIVQRPVAVAPLGKGDLEVELQRVKLEEATLPEMVSEVRRQWSKALDGRPVPAIAVVGRAHDGIDFYRPTFTCDLANIPVAEFLRYIEPATGYGVVIAGEGILLKVLAPGHADWETAFVPVSLAGQRFLRLTAQTTPEDIKTRLEAWGIRLCQGDDTATWMPREQRLIVTAHPHETGKLLGLLSLIDRGCQITEPEAQH